MIEGIELLSDCTSHHKADALAYWGQQLAIGLAVTLRGGPARSPVEHTYRVRASSIKAGIETAKRINWIVPGMARAVKVRLLCPCDCR